MPISRYYSGHGERVMRDMVAHYGKKKGKSVFYATANKRKAAAKPRTLMDGLRD